VQCFTVLAIIGIPAVTLSQNPASPSPGAPSAQNTSDAPPAPTKRQIDAASAAYLAGARLLDRNNLLGAEKQFEKAVKLNPKNPEYAQAVLLAKEHRVTDLVQQAGKARLMGQREKAESLLAEAAALDPQNNIVQQHMSPPASLSIFHPEIEPWTQDGPSIAGPVTLLPNPGTRSVHSRGDVHDVVRQVVSTYGITPTFDDSVARQNLRIDLDDVSYRDAASVVLEMAHLFAVPVDSKSILVIKDTPENRQRFERELQETIYIPALTPEQMNELKTVVSNVFDIKQATTQNGSGTLVLRAPQETLTAVNLTLADLLDGGAEILLDLNLYAVDRTRTRDIGVTLPQQIGIYSAEGAAHDLVAANQSLVNQAIAQGLIPPGANDITIALALISSGLVKSTLFSSTIGFFGGGLTLMGVTASPNASLHLALNSSDTRALDNIQLRIGDRQTGTFRAGTRYPITTGVYSSGLSGSLSQLQGVTINGVSAANLLSQNSTVSIPQIQYEDLGLTLTAKPTVQKSGKVSLHLELKIEALAGTSLNNIPILANRLYISDVTVNNGETALLASSLTKLESAAISGYPGLGELPGFQPAFADKTTEADINELVLLITPHIVRRRSNIIAGPRIALNSPTAD
jgi:type II secretory pathway component GspD/PulD (secretin)